MDAMAPSGPPWPGGRYPFSGQPVIRPRPGSCVMSCGGVEDSAITNLMAGVPWSTSKPTLAQGQFGRTWCFTRTRAAHATEFSYVIK